MNEIKTFAGMAAYMMIAGFALAMLLWFIGYMIRIGLNLMRMVKTA